MIERFNGRLPGYLGNGNDKTSFSHIDDVAEGHIAALKKGQPGERYLLTGENASFMDVFDIAAAFTGTEKPRFKIPLLIIEVYGWISVLVSRITGKLPMISPPWAYSCEKAKTELEYNPRSLKEGLAEFKFQTGAMQQSVQIYHHAIVVVAAAVVRLHHTFVVIHHISNVAGQQQRGG
ncbi:farnesol dehydrogenase (NAD(+)) [Sarracenia purpurea var. burkii]